MITAKISWGLKKKSENVWEIYIAEQLCVHCLEMFVKTSETGKNCFRSDFFFTKYSNNYHRLPYQSLLVQNDYERKTMVGFRSSLSQMFFKVGVLKNFTTRVFFCQIFEIFKNAFFCRTPPVAASLTLSA